MQIYNASIIPRESLNSISAGEQSALLVLLIIFYYRVGKRIGNETDVLSGWYKSGLQNVGMNNPLIRTATWAARARSVPQQLVPCRFCHHVRQWTCTVHACVTRVFFPRRKITSSLVRVTLFLVVTTYAFLFRDFVVLFYTHKNDVRSTWRSTNGTRVNAHGLVET